MPSLWSMARPWPIASLALLLTGCGNDDSAAARSGSPIDTGVLLPSPAALDTPQVGPLPPPPLATGDGWHTDFTRAFTDGLVVERPEERLFIKVVDVGTVTLENDGPLVVMDPLGAADPLELPVRLPAGTYTVQVSRVRIALRDGSASVTQLAAARLLLGPGPVRTWHWVGEHAVDSGLSALLTREAARAVEQRRPAVERQMNTAISRDPLTAGAIPTRPAASADLAFFAAGTGDRPVEFYVGVDEEGRGVEVVADFGILLEPVESLHSFVDPASWPPGLLSKPDLDEMGIEVRRAHPHETVPSTGAPVWIAIDARSIARDPRRGFPRVEAMGVDGEPVPIEVVTEGYRLWIPMPRDQGQGIRTLVLILQTGVQPV